MAYSNKLQAAKSELATLECLVQELAKTASWNGLKHIKEDIDRVEKQADNASIKWAEYIGAVTDEHLATRMAPKGPRELHSLAEKLNDVRVKVRKIETELTTLPEKPAATSRPPVNYLQKLETPTFGGNYLDYEKFKRRFCDTVGRAGVPESVELEYLTMALPKSHQHLVDNSHTLERAWKKLDKKFGKRIHSILAIIQRFMDADLSHGKNYERMEKLASEV